MGKESQPRPGGRRWYRPIDCERFQLHPFFDEPPAPIPQRPVEETISGFMKELGLQQSLRAQELIEAWPSLVGRQIAARARPGPVERGVLIVYVNSSPWLQELSRFAQRQILEKVHARFGNREIRSIRMLLDPDLQEPPPTQPSRFRRRGE